MLAKNILEKICNDIQQEITDKCLDLDFSDNLELEDNLNKIDVNLSDIKELKFDNVSVFLTALRFIQNKDIDEINFNKNSLEILILILSKIFSVIEIDGWEIEIDVDNYSLKTVAYSNCENIAYINDNDKQNAMLLVDMENKDGFESFLNGEADINYLLLILIYCMDINVSYEKILLCRMKYDTYDTEELETQELNSKISFIKLINVMKGKTFHKPEEYNFNGVALTFEFKSELVYSQFSDILEVMNEYNMQKYILDKFLRIYQVIENFMYKIQICEMSKKVNYRMFTIRDFRAMNERFTKNEKESLSDLFQKIGEVEIDGVKIKQRILGKWNQLNVDTDPTSLENIKKAMRLVGATKKHDVEYVITSLNENALVNIFTSIVYSVRCSVVHNKVNEYHITYANLDTCINELLEKFALPALEEIVYGLMLNQNDLIWYEKPEIILY